MKVQLRLVLCVYVVSNTVSAAMWRDLSSPENQKELVQALKDSGELRVKRVVDVLLSVDRGLYCTRTPYVDGPMSIGYGATISAPHMHAYCLQKLVLQLVEGARVLDVGSGSGYLTVCMALMVGKSGLAVGVEHIPELLKRSIDNVNYDKPELINSGRIKFLEGDGRKGCVEEGPYDAIHVGAAAVEVPKALLDQLKPGGRLVIPVGDPDQVQVMTIVDKRPDGSIVTSTDSEVRFVPLTDRRQQYDPS